MNSTQPPKTEEQQEPLQSATAKSLGAGTAQAQKAEVVPSGNPASDARPVKPEDGQQRPLKRKPCYVLKLPKVIKDYKCKEFQKSISKGNLGNPNMSQNAQPSSLTDYFNYGFNELTFHFYCNKVKKMMMVAPGLGDYDPDKRKLKKLNDKIPLDFGGLSHPVNPDFQLQNNSEQEIDMLNTEMTDQLFYSYIAYVKQNHGRNQDIDIIQYLSKSFISEIVGIKTPNEPPNAHLYKQQNQINKLQESPYLKVMLEKIEKYHKELSSVKQEDDVYFMGEDTKEEVKIVIVPPPIPTAMTPQQMMQMMQPIVMQPQYILRKD